MRKLLTAALAFTALAAPATAAFADDQGRGRGHGHDERRHYDRGRYDYDNRDDRRDERRAYRRGYREGQRDDRWNDRRYYGQPRYARPPVYYAQPRRVWNRGHYLPREYHRYVVYDPYRYGLYAPPRGHAWLHVGNDVYLTALATGLIVEVLRDSYY